jgi:hypothetical protein
LRRTAPPYRPQADTAAATAIQDGLVVQPLADLAVPAAGDAKASRLVVADGKGRAYVDRTVDGPTQFLVGGSLGWHRAALLGPDDALLAEWRFRVECETHIDDGDAGFGQLLRGLHFTLCCANTQSVLVDGRVYRLLNRWLRDHTHSFKGDKYFGGDFKTALELFARMQREDGMIYERIAPKSAPREWRDHTFGKGDFIRTVNPGGQPCYTLQRIPVENDVEFLFIECLYRTWQATGDTAWMSRHLDHAVQAVRYATSDPYRWSEMFQLLKRGYTIDTWDFMHVDDSALTPGNNVCDIDKTTLGVMHGDNTGMAMACRMLAEMLDVANRAEEAATYRKLADDLLQRLEKVAWDERGYYRHHVSEDPSFQRDMGGTDETAQVSLSNAYALNRGIGNEKCVAILATYRRIRDEMPAASPGEFYNIYPPFAKGFGHANGEWQYMNGGVSTIVAGELARGAFAQGEAAYGVDILRRLKSLADRHGGYLHVCFNGNPRTTPPPRSFTTVDLAPVANVTAAYRDEGGWGEDGNDLRNMPTGAVAYHDVPFNVAADGRGLGIARNAAGFARERRVPVSGKHASMYLLHTAARPGSPTAEMDVVYSDGETRRVYLAPGKQFDSWFMPGSGLNMSAGHAPKLPAGWPEHQLAWRGRSDTFDNVGVFIWGWNNPRPGVEIAELIFRAAENDSVYFVPGITFSDHPVWFPQNDVSFGIPDGWGAAAVVYALIEGLAGVVDRSTMFDAVELSPRWIAAHADHVRAAVTYPASGGYVAYDYAHDAECRHVTMTVTGSGHTTDLLLLLPEQASEVAECIVNNRPAEFQREVIGQNVHARVRLEGIGPHDIRLTYADSGIQPV